MSEEIIGRRFQLSSFQIIILGFAGVILLGALLLMLPISTQEGCITPFNEALFTATSAVCVTGLVIHDTGSYWSAFGQTVILALIQIVCGSQNIKACIAEGGNRMKDCHPNTVPAIVAAEHRQHGKCTNHFNQKCSPQDKLRKPDDTAYIWR